MRHVVTWIRQCDELLFQRLIRNSADVTLHDARLETVEFAQMDALMLTGGGDIYRESVGLFEDFFDHIRRTKR